ncbi:MAG: cysteine dioxygenase family protein [Planctomycetota bacterium]
MSRINLDRWITHLRGLEGAALEPARVFEVLADPRLDADEIVRRACFRDDRYTRTSIYRSATFDVIVLGWSPGQHTPIHNHAGQCGWVRLVRGRIEEQAFAYAGGAAHADLGGVDIDDEGVGHGVDLEPTTYTLATESGTVVAVDRDRAIHRLGNPVLGRGDEPTVTLHVYSKPHDSCLVFDPDQRTCRRRELRFD